MNPKKVNPKNLPNTAFATWYEYQEEVAEFFRGLNFEAETNVSVEGARTSHNVDVIVRSKHAGFDVRWIVECKSWKTAIPKEKVLALRTIVNDTGVDRGFIMAERGYQAGALEAARHANVMLTSLEDLRETLAYDLGLAQLRFLLARIESCRNRYWNISKTNRIDLDLRPDVTAVGYSGAVVIQAVDHTVRQALFNGFPITYDRTYSALSAYSGRGDRIEPGMKGAIENPSQLSAVLNAEISELESRLDAAEGALRQRKS